MMLVCFIWSVEGLEGKDWRKKRVGRRNFASRMPSNSESHHRLWLEFTDVDLPYGYKICHPHNCIRQLPKIPPSRVSSSYWFCFSWLIHRLLIDMCIVDGICGRWVREGNQGFFLMFGFWTTQWILMPLIDLENT